MYGLVRLFTVRLLNNMIAFETRASTVLYNILCSNKQRGKYLLPANICPIVPLVFIKANIAFKFVDISLETLCIDEAAVVKLLKQDPQMYAGIIFVRTYGALHDTAKFFSKVKLLDPQLLIIDDRCLCLPEFPDVTPRNTDVLLYSTGEAKQVNLGTGGYGILSHEVCYKRQNLPFSEDALEKVTKQYMKALAKRELFVKESGDWLDTSQPIFDWSAYKDLVLVQRLKMIQHKALLNKIYTSQIPAKIQLHERFQQWRFNIFVNYKSNIIKSIFDAGLFASGHYASLGGIFSSEKMPNAEQIHATVINLFNDEYFDEQKALQLAELLKREKNLL
jgi:hypothetical protein